MCQIYFLEIDESKHDDWLDILKTVVSPEKWEHAMKYRYPIDRLLTLCSDAIVRFLACSQLYIKNSDIEFHKNEYGKPYLKGYSNFCFNISHTKNALVVAVSDNEIGVDIERAAIADLKIAERFFAYPEREYILNSSDKSRAFYEIWTKKEAYIKYKGTGLSMNLNSFNVFDDAIKEMTYTTEHRGYIISACGVNPSSVAFCEADTMPFLKSH